MAPESDYQRLKRLFEAVADLGDAPAQRAGLDALGASADDRDRVLAMLAPQVATRIGAPVAAMMASAVGAELQPGDRLGQWRLTALLGAGGMGRVFEAERDDGLYRQRTAIKLLRGLPGPAGLERLARERRILASLQHPHIARLIDGGSTPRGHPYLVMEHVSGIAIDAWCRLRPRRLGEVLALMDQVGQAVAAAHRQLVLHCDLKPANVLVTEEGRAMLLDFGIAQLEGEDTAALGVALTPHFASPEQAAGRGLTVATDIFGLGRLLQTLLPLAADASAREDEWSAIAARATAPDPEARYPTVPALLDDLRRLQAHLPLQALPPRAAYRIRKALRRRWPWALAGAAALAGSAAFTLGLVAERDRARAAERRAMEEAATTRQVGEFIVGLFRDADPRQAGRPDLPAHELLQRGRERAASDLAGRPAQQAAVGRVLAEAFENLGRSEEAEPLYEQVAALQGSGALQQPLAAAETLSRLATLRANTFRYAQAEGPARRSLEERLARLGDDALEVADARNTLGMVLLRLNRFDEGQTLLERALEVRRRRLDPEGLEVATTLHNLGFLHHTAERHAKGEALYREALAIKRKRLPPEHLSVLNTVENLAQVLSHQQRLAEAEPLWRELLDTRRRVHGPRSWQVSNTLNNLASQQQDAGRLQEAVQRYREALEADPNAEDAITRAVTWNNLASALEDQGETAAAEAAYRRSLALRIARNGEDDLGVARVQHNLGRFLFRQGRVAEAAALVDKALSTRQRRQGDSHSDTALSRLLAGEIRLRQGDAAGAAALVAPVLQATDRLPPQRQPVAARMAALLAAARGDAAESLRQWQRCWQLASQHLPPTHAVRLWLGVEYAQVLVEAGRAASARELLEGLRGPLGGFGEAAPMQRRAAALQSRLGPASASGRG